MLRFHRSSRCSHVARIAGTVALILLVCAGAAHADLVGQHAGANQLILSGDGKIAFTSDDAQTRVWDVAATRELAALPGQVLAVSGDGQRVLCDRWNQGVNRYGFWRLAEGHWQRGTTVMQHIEKSPFIIDATFVNDEAVVMWLGRVERFAPDGTTRTSRQYDEGDRLASGSPKTSPPVGALSSDGKRLVLWDRGWARVCDTTTGKRLSPLYEPKELRGNGRKYSFSPDNKFVLESLNSSGDGGYFAEEGPPILTNLAVYDAKNGKSLRVLEDVGSFNFPFWPTDNYSLIFQVYVKTNQWKLERRDARTNAILPWNLSKLSLPERWLRTLIITDDGKSYVALDEKGDIWAEPLH